MANATNYWTKKIRTEVLERPEHLKVEIRYYIDLAHEEDHKDHPKCDVLISRLERMKTGLHRVVLDPANYIKQIRPSKRDRFPTANIFDFSRYTTRHIALKIVYIGWDYSGFVTQDDTEKTIEHEIFQALQKTCLIEKRETSNYHRCGRTDKGVSAFSQVISLDIRSNLVEGEDILLKDDMGPVHARKGDKSKELKYMAILNRVLPSEIRVIAWAPVCRDFSARFDCNRRVYKYFFPVGDLNVQAMANAAVRLIGEHDFRNLCKMDVGNGVTNFRRRIENTELLLLDQRENGYQMCELTITGQAFLWHQIRCIMAVLFMVGEGKETPLVIESLLDVERYPNKPQYTMASELPLVLFECEFEDVDWIYEPEVHVENINRLQEIWAKEQVRSTMLLRMLEELQDVQVKYKGQIKQWKDHKRSVLNQSSWLIPGKQPNVANHKPLMERATGDSLETKMQVFADRKERQKAAAIKKEFNETQTATNALLTNESSTHPTINMADLSSHGVQILTNQTLNVAEDGSLLAEECDAQTTAAISQILGSMYDKSG